MITVMMIYFCIYFVGAVLTVFLIGYFQLPHYEYPSAFVWPIFLIILFFKWLYKVGEQIGRKKVK